MYVCNPSDFKIYGPQENSLGEENKLEKEPHSSFSVVILLYLPESCVVV